MFDCPIPSFKGLRRRDAGYPAPPPQTRTCSFSASGSSVVLTFARTVTVARFTAQLLLPAVRLARVAPSCMPARVSFADCVLPSGPSPCGRLPRPPTAIRDKTARRHPAVARLPGCSMRDDSTRAHAVAGLIAFLYPRSVGFLISLHPRAFKAPEFSDASLPACHGLRTPMDLPSQAIAGSLSRLRQHGPSLVTGTVAFPIAFRLMSESASSLTSRPCLPSGPSRRSPRWSSCSASENRSSRG
jgi:hypothetical protein